MLRRLGAQQMPANAESRELKMWDFGILVPITAIIFGCGIPIVKTITNHQKEMWLLKQQNAPRVDDSSIDSLRREIMQLRDTTTQYDMSVERALNQIRSRLTNVEDRLGVHVPPLDVPTQAESPSQPQATVPMQGQVSEPQPQTISLGN